MSITVTGTVAGIIYRNEENGYTVLSLDCSDGDDIVCVGSFATLSVGAVLCVTGEVSVHSKYGEQLAVSGYEVKNPTNRQGIVKYLSGGLIKGVGEKTADRIYDMFGDDTFGVIENNPALLARVKGISVKRAMEIANSVASLKVMQSQIMFLQGFGISTNLAIKIYNIYKGDTDTLVKENPYRLIDDVDGVGFLTADKIAQSMSIPAESGFRVRAAFVHALKEAAEKQGNTFLYFDDLISRSGELLQLDLTNYEILVEDTIEQLVLEPTVKVFFAEHHRRAVALLRYYKLEKSIAYKLLDLSASAKRISMDADALIKSFETVNKINFHESQSGAVKSAVFNGVTVITGGPGTGKTTIIKCIAEILSTHGLRVEFCAPTGRAAKRLSQSTGRDAKTIHRLLGYESHGGMMAFKYNRNNTLSCDAVIVDELSMVDVSVMYSLLSALENGTRLILVGDKDQLPSVGAGNVLSDIIKSGAIEIRYLTHVYRQSEDSLIITNAHLVNSGHMPEINNQSRDFFVMPLNDYNEVAKTVVQLVTTRLPKFTGLPSEDIQVLGALKNGVSGVENLNKLLQEALNPFVFGKQEIQIGKNVIRAGDRVMQTVNNYELPFKRFSESGMVEEGAGVFNGDIGVVQRVDRGNGVLEVLFDDNRLATYAQQDFSDLQLAYAITIHKSQGSEFEVVVVPLVSGPPGIINKNLLYTAMTRAKRAVVLVGSKKVLALMVHNNYIAARTTNLKRFLQEGIKTVQSIMQNAQRSVETEDEDGESLLQE
ncbi:MAG: ATP-dependent RecD-like DNA helicase [Corallococcus sp.]|nr:ATP-dependent RecD-like DNA helicase [Corallococcus sp.]MCM1359035.1 ATP-dependent RecD-like DNA helicase [Corallococcus sp.]MCM1395024.1 ATP-dependent RecD-like DNA helicase [Corallococcus sp.]